MADTVMMHTRIDRALKQEAEQILAGIGMTPSEAIRLFLHRIRVERALPLKLTYEPLSSEKEKNWLDLAGTAPYPLTGMDAQAWVSAERETSDRDEQALTPPNTSLAPLFAITD